MIQLELKSLKCVEETETDADNKYTGFMEAIIGIIGTEITMTYSFQCLSYNSQTGDEVDAQRLKQVTDYLIQINNVQQ